MFWFIRGWCEALSGNLYLLSSSKDCLANPAIDLLEGRPNLPECADSESENTNSVG